MEAKMLDGKVAMITGASYGMGQSMAELFAEEGASVVLTARGREKLDQVVEGIRPQRGTQYPDKKCCHEAGRYQYQMQCGGSGGNGYAGASGKQGW